MKVQKSKMITEASYSQDEHHRYLITKVWNEKLPKATVIMLNPSIADAISIDMTTMYIINNISKLNHGSVEIVNMFSRLNEQITTEMEVSSMTNEENDKVIVESVARTEKTILAWGKGVETNKKIKQRAEEIQVLIKEYGSKVYELVDERGRSGWHPLAPAVRNGWKLKKVTSNEIGVCQICCRMYYSI